MLSWITGYLALRTRNGRFSGSLIGQMLEPQQVKEFILLTINKCKLAIIQSC